MSEQVEEVGREERQKEWGMVPWGTITLSDARATDEARKMSAHIASVVEDFKSIVENIMCADEETLSAHGFSNRIEALASLTDELGEAVTGIESDEKSFLQKAISLFKSTTKREEGVDYSASDYAYVPDASKPSTWKLRMAEGSSGNITAAQLGRAAAAVSPGKLHIPSDEIASVKSKLRSQYKELGVKPGDMPDSIKEVSFFTFKENDRTRWVTIFSNNYRDREQEILSQASHKDFVKAVDTGEWPMPDLWLWHVDGTKIGTADMLTYTDEGFMVASGLADQSKEHILKNLENYDGLLGVSHGMPRAEIEYDPSDEKTITRYRSREISILPVEKAANVFTGCFIHREAQMSLPNDKKNFLLEAGMSPDEVSAIETTVASKKQAAEGAGLDSKEADPVETVAEVPTAEVAQAESVQEIEVTPQLIAEAIAISVNEALTPVLESMKELSAKVETLEKSADESATNTFSQTPASSLIDMVRSMRAVGADETQVDGRSKEAKGPAVTVKQVTGIPVLDALIGG